MINQKTWMLKKESGMMKMNSKKIVEAIKYWGQVFLLPIYWLSFLVPRDKKIWVFGSSFGKRFADNPRYFYLYISHQKNIDIKAVWISRNKNIVKELKDKGYLAYSNRTPLGMLYCLRAYVYIYDNYSKDISFWLSGGAKKINTWHGVPLKKIQMDNIFDKVRHPENAWQKFKWHLRRLSDEKPSHFILTTSENLQPIFQSAFITKNVFVCGYPRNDIFFRGSIKNIYLDIETEYLNLLHNLKIKKGMQIVLYMPTFRNSEIRFFDLINLKNFNDFLCNKRIIFCVKLHPKSKLQNYFRQIQSKNIYVFPNDLDPYFFINEIDVLVTDYSSIYFDFLLADKPIIFFDYDLNEYLKESREMYFEYNAYTPGIKVETVDDLTVELDKIHLLKQDNELRYRRKIIREKIFDNIDGNSSERLYYEIKKI